ncbi:MAG: non-canonical purine NTP pyrophosphatase [Planctomycetaceae bacterium]|nr:MAG: non-canonical purine NTP pyrophosphatase [Planctomycetaceae bacterium]
MTCRPVVVLGSSNRKKVSEMAQLLAPYGWELRGLDAYPPLLAVTEDGSTFRENAEKKAQAYAQQLGEWVIGEDSGLCVDALGGQPGIYSARFAGEPSDDDANNRRLIAMLKEVPPERRTARYVCVAVLADPRGEVRAVGEGHCAGLIIDTPRGSAGFGYDPLFFIPEYHATFAELGPMVKRVLSHRARAFEQLIPQMLRCYPPTQAAN